MPGFKSLLRQVLSGAVAGRHDGLSRPGLWAEKLARYLIFVSREARQAARVNTNPEVRPVWRPNPADGVIYDVGANNGDDTAYYLSKGLKVVAIEANATLARQVARRFAAQVALGELIVLNVAVTNSDQRSATFYIHGENDQLSSTIASGPDRGGYTQVEVEACRLSDLVAQNGAPYYVKIDIEGADAAVLDDLFSAGHRPRYVSAEAHHIEVFCQLAQVGYRKFKVIEGKYVDRPYYRLSGQSAIDRPLGACFVRHSSGPFGEDIPGPWIGPDETFRYLSEQGLGWKDIHASL